MLIFVGGPRRGEYQLPIVGIFGTNKAGSQIENFFSVSTIACGRGVLDKWSGQEIRNLLDER